MTIHSVLLVPMVFKTSRNLEKSMKRGTLPPSLAPSHRSGSPPLWSTTGGAEASKKALLPDPPLMAPPPPPVPPPPGSTGMTAGAEPRAVRPAILVRPEASSQPTAPVAHADATTATARGGEPAERGCTGLYAELRGGGAAG